MSNGPTYPTCLLSEPLPHKVDVVRAVEVPEESLDIVIDTPYRDSLDRNDGVGTRRFLDHLLSGHHRSVV